MTVTWENVYDYLRCPKILAFKMAGFKSRIISRCTSPKIEPHVAGRIGEYAVEALLQPLTSSESDVTMAEKALSVVEEGGLLPMSMAKEITRALFRRHPYLKERLLKKLESTQIQVDETVRTLLERAVAGIQVSAVKIRELYGELELLGRAEAKAPIFPSWFEPDFVFRPVSSQNMIIVEVKNKARGLRISFRLPSTPR